MLAAIALCVPAAALAQTPAPEPATTTTATIPQAASGVSTRPPVALGDGATTTPTTSAAAPVAPAPAAPSATASGELPNTGADPWLVALLGAALTLLGVGLRLQTADADLY